MNTNDVPKPTPLTENAKAALTYYEHEASRPHYWGGKVKPMGGLTLDKFRLARDELARKGVIVQREGRWILTEHAAPDTPQKAAA